MGKWLAGLTATVIGALAIAVLTPMIVQPPSAPRVPAIEGTWTFVRFEGPTPTFGLATVRITAISFQQDGSYSASGSVLMPGIGSIDAGGGGSYKPIDAKTIKLEQKGDKPGTQVYEYAASGNELKLSVPGTYTMVFRRV